MATKYTPIKDLPLGTPIERCAQVLANKLQCWKAGDVLVEEEPGAEGSKAPAPPSASQAQGTVQGAQPKAGGPSAQKTEPALPEGSVAPPTQGPKDAPPATAGGSNAPAPPTGKTYQLCNTHALMHQRAEQQEQKTPTKPGEKSPLDKMLGVQMDYITTVPIHSKEETHHHKTLVEKAYDKIVEPSEQEQSSSPSGAGAGKSESSGSKSSGQASGQEQSQGQKS